MTPRERVYRAIKFQDTDVVPYNAVFSIEAHRKMVDYYSDENFIEQIGNHLAILSQRQSSKWTELAPGHRQDEWGVTWNRTIDKDIGVVENQVLSQRTLRGFEFPDPAASAAFDAYPGFIGTNQDRFRAISFGFSLFERAWSLRGMENLLIDMMEAPGFVNELLERLMQHNLALIERALGYDVDSIFFGDDWGSQAGLIMGPALWREFIKPRISRMYRRVHDAGKLVMIHCCGDVKCILPELIEAGVDVFNPFQPETMDVYRTKELYYGRLAFYGGISVQHLLPHGTPDEVRRETKKLLKVLGRGGGYIASPSHVIPSDVPAENIAAMIEVFQGQVG